jgi:ATP-dependent DNA helicase DinG
MPDLRLSPFPIAVQAAFLPGGALARPGQEQVARLAQAEMAASVADTVERGGVLVVEAGTGVGKTWAYLAPLLLGGRKAWLSTATQALQDQLFQRDIPALSKALGLPVRAALLKGRSNYVCVQRLDMARSGALQTSGGADPAWASALSHVHRWANASVTGDLAELPELDDRSALRPWISSTRENCLGQACPRLADCHVLRARRLAGQADWVVINHHLFIAGLMEADPGGDELWPALLPKTDVVVFDEAHSLVELGETRLGLSVGSEELHAMARDVHSLGSLWAKGMRAWAHIALLLEQAARSVAKACKGQGGGGGQLTWEGDLPKGLGADWQQGRLAVWQALGAAAEALASVSGAASALQQLSERAHRLRDAWRVLVQDGPAGAEHVRWIEWSGDGAWRVVRSAPNFAAVFRQAMAAPEGPGSWVFTSATLGTDPALTWFASAMDWSDRPDVRRLCIPSPFDHAAQAALYVPESLPEPADERHSPALATLIAEWAQILGGRTLVLTTSLRASTRIAAALRVSASGAAGSGLHILAQGHGSKRALLSRFRQAAAAGQGAVLVASASFWQGVDLAGDVLQLLVIDKLPFPSPGDPLTRVRSQRAREQGLDDFRNCYLDKAALALKQGAGRLIRSASDRGVLVIADRRLLTQGYGAELLAALPDMRRLMDASEMRDALAQLAKAVPPEQAAPQG